MCALYTGKMRRLQNSEIPDMGEFESCEHFMKWFCWGNPTHPPALAVHKLTGARTLTMQGKTYKGKLSTSYVNLYYVILAKSQDMQGLRLVDRLQSAWKWFDEQRHSFPNKTKPFSAFLRQHVMKTCEWKQALK